MSKIRPLSDKILVEPLGGEEITKSGIVLPDSAKEKPQEGKVIAVSKGKYIDDKLVPLDVKVGDKVIFGKYAGDEVKINGKELKIIREEDVLGIIEE